MLFAACEQVLAARPALLQYRNKSTDPALRLAQAHTLRALTRTAGVGLIINDDVALAEQVGADGVHLGRDDGDIAAARARLGEHAILGASCYDQLPLAHAAVAAGADYIAFGAVLPVHHQTQRRARPAQPVCRQRRTGRATGGDWRDHPGHSPGDCRSRCGYAGGDWWGV